MTHRATSRALFFAVLVIPIALAVSNAAAGAEAEIVIGGRLNAEGGDWDPATSPLKSPFGIDFSAAGEMFIVELEGGRVHRLGKDGALSRVAGDGSKSYTGDEGPAEKATFNGMHNAAMLPSGHLLIADSWNHCIRCIDLGTGIISTFAGTGEAGFAGDGGTADEARFDFLMCITLSPDAKTLHVADLKNLRVRAIDMESGFITTIAGNGEKGVPEDGSPADGSPLVDPRAVAADAAGNVYILERSGHALRVVTPDGKIKTAAGDGQRGFRDGPALTAQLNSPKHLCVDKAGNVIIADEGNQRIRKCDPKAGTLTTILGGGQEAGAIRLKMPHGVCVENGLLYVVDTGHNRILKMENW